MTSFVRVDYFKVSVEWMRHCYNSQRKILQLLVTQRAEQRDKDTHQLPDYFKEEQFA